MLNLLNASVGQYLKENIVLTVVLALILALIAALSCIMIYLQVMAKRKGDSAENDNTEEAPAEELTQKSEDDVQEREEPEAAEVEPVQAEQEKEPEQEAPAAEKQEEPAAVAEQKETEEPAPKADSAAVIKEEEKPVGFQSGKWVIRKTEEKKYVFTLYASNGSVMLESSKEYSSLTTAKQGVETYKKNFAANNCKVVSTKPGHFVFRLTNANGMLLAVSPNYKSKSSCENALENTKAYASGAPVEVI